MSCIPCISEGEGSSIPVEDIDRWTNSLQRVLESKDGRRHFLEFLRTRGLEESECTLEWWERCNVFVETNKESMRHGHRQLPIAKLHLTSDAKALVQYAEDRINFDLAQVQQLNDAVQSGKLERIKETFNAALRSAAELLEDDYKLFRSQLLRQKGLTAHQHR